MFRNTVPVPATEPDAHDNDVATTELIPLSVLELDLPAPEVGGRKPAGNSFASPGGSSSKPPHVESTSPPSTPTSTQSTAYATCTTSTSGKSRPAFRPCPPTSWSIAATTATNASTPSPIYSKSATASTTPRSVDHPSMTIVPTEDLARRLHGRVTPPTSQERDH
jgi:hypothetical protein